MATIIDGVFRLRKKLGEGGMAQVFLVDVDRDRFDYTTLYAYTQVEGKTHAERRRHAEELTGSLREKPLDAATVRGLLEARGIPVPPARAALKIAMGKVHWTRFEGEWKNLLCLNHENVIHVYGGGVWQDRPYYVMEWVPDPLPSAAIVDLPLRDRLAIVLQGGRGLAHLHAQDIVHRDVKPENLLVAAEDGGYRVKVTDLGVAKDLGEDLGLTKTNAVIGTPYYVAPEQLASTKSVTPRADIYSLGATLYELLTGMRPFHDKNSLLEIVGAVTQGQAPLPPRTHVANLPPALASIVECAMAADPQKRYGTMEEFLRDLEAYLAVEDPAILALDDFGKALPAESAASSTARTFLFDKIRRRGVRRTGRGRTRTETAEIRPTRTPAAARQARRGTGSSRRLSPLAWGGLGLVLLALLVGVIVLRGRTDKPRPAPQPRDPGEGIPIRPAHPPRPVAPARTEEEEPPPADTPESRLHAAMRERNPAYNGRGHFVVEEGAVVEVECNNGGLVDLTPLHGLPLRRLEVRNNGLSDLSPLRGMPLAALSCDNNKIENLAPLRGMPLTVLHCSDNKIDDLAPLEGMKLQELSCYENLVEDLAPLRGMPLRSLNVCNCRIRSLAPLAQSPLRELFLSHNAVEDLTPLRGRPLGELVFTGNRVSDLAPLQGLKLWSLNCSDNRIASLAPLEGMPLKSLFCENNAVTDLAPLRGMPLAVLHIGGNAIADLTPLAGMSLRQFRFSTEHVKTGMDVIRGMDTLTQIGDTSLDYLSEPAKFWERYDREKGERP